MGKLVAAVGSIAAGPRETTLLIVGGRPPEVEALSSQLTERFDSLSVSALSDLTVTVEAVGVANVDVVVVDRPDLSAVDTTYPSELVAETTTVAVVDPEDRQSAPDEATVVERRGDWLERLDAWLRSQMSPDAETAADSRAQYERLLERQNHRLKEFTEIISHDLRNPLQVVSSRAELARETGDGSHLEAIVETADRMETFLDDLLDLASQGTIVGDPEAVALDAAARNAWAQIDTAEATLACHDPGCVVADPGRLRSLLANLFSNAVVHAGPDVTVTVGRLPDGFFVADDGPGVPQDERDSIFEHGHTSSEDGTGFGLSIVRSIASAHGWEVRLAEMDYPARPGGACFEITGVERPPADDDGVDRSSIEDTAFERPPTGDDC